jgi:hypothetical protein
MTAKIISTETTRWCERGKPFGKGQKQFLVNNKQVAVLELLEHPRSQLLDSALPSIKFVKIPVFTSF